MRAIGASGRVWPAEAGEHRLDLAPVLGLVLAQVMQHPRPAGPHILVLLDPVEIRGLQRRDALGEVRPDPGEAFQVLTERLGRDRVELAGGVTNIAGYR